MLPYNFWTVSASMVGVVCLRVPAPKRGHDLIGYLCWKVSAGIVVETSNNSDRDVPFCQKTFEEGEAAGNIKDVIRRGFNINVCAVRLAEKRIRC